MIRSSRTLALAVVALATASSLAAKKPVPGPAPLTTGDQYDRNPSHLVQGKDRFVFFARSQAPCDRLAGCPADNTTYDLWALTSRTNGKSNPQAQLIAVNPGAPDFYGRTSAAVATDDGAIHVYWASGGNGNVLYHVERAPGASTWTVTPVPGGPVFNVDAVTDGTTIYLYQENEMGELFVRTSDGTSYSAPTLIDSQRNIPKVLIDSTGTFRLAMVDATLYPQVDVRVASSPDGLTWGPDQVAVASDGTVSNWDPVLAEDGAGYTLYYAPDLNTGTQRIAFVTSPDFTNWSSPTVVTQETPGGWWDYWPETGDAKAGPYFTSEAPVGTMPAGTGHIWTLSAGK